MVLTSDCIYPPAELLLLFVFVFYSSFFEKNFKGHISVITICAHINIRGHLCHYCIVLLKRNSIDLPSY